jgi:hypothetical protein
MHKCILLLEFTTISMSKMRRKKSFRHFLVQVLQMSVPPTDDDTLRKSEKHDRELWHPFNLVHYHKILSLMLRIDKALSAKPNI